MTHSNSPTPTGQADRRRTKATVPLAWSLLSIVLYAIAGLLLAVFIPPYWIWPIALVGTLFQALALAGPQALQVLGRWQARWAVMLGILGSGGLVVALAIAVNHSGPSDIDAIELQETALVILAVNVGVILLTAVCTLVGAKTGDQFFRLFRRTRSSLVLAGLSFFGLFIGGLIGIAIAS